MVKVSEIQSDQVLDVTGLNCPLPVLRLKQVLKSMSEGEVVHMVATDKSTAHDIPSFCRQTGHELLNSSLMSGGLYLFWIKKLD